MSHEFVGVSITPPQINGVVPTSPPVGASTLVGKSLIGQLNDGSCKSMISAFLFFEASNPPVTTRTFVSAEKEKLILKS